MTVEFEAWPKIARLNRGMVITEKIDGTNAAIIITADGEIAAQSRTRMITMDDDNYGFAKWVASHQSTLVETLGEGRHFGEWWGAGIQRRYAMTEKRFSLFNTSRWLDTDLTLVDGLDVVPILAAENFSTEAVATAVERLRTLGSVASPGFMNPEGVVVFLSAARSMFKVTLEKDDQPKGLAA